MVLGVMSATNILPDDEPLGTDPSSTPFTSKYASMKRLLVFRSHDAARGSELAAGTYRA